jgi:orotate phosphoribosyltransferase
MVYVRSKAKNHGTSKLIEGETKPKQKIVVIEDLLSTGQSCLQVVNTLRKAKLQVLGVVAIFSYNMDICIKNFKINNCSYHTLTNLDVLSQVAIKNKYINLKQQKRILNFRDCPKGKW